MDFLFLSHLKDLKENNLLSYSQFYETKNLFIFMRIPNLELIVILNLYDQGFWTYEMLVVF